MCPKSTLICLRFLSHYEPSLTRNALARPLWLWFLLRHIHAQKTFSWKGLMNIVTYDLQMEGLIENRVQSFLLDASFLFCVTNRIWYKLEFNVRIRWAIWIHWNEILCFTYWKEKNNQQKMVNLLKREPFNHVLMMVTVFNFFPPRFLLE